ncbi:MAG TPA: hypothetical protein V6C97_02455 [Oculatellaceae cyanobacterium]
MPSQVLASPTLVLTWSSLDYVYDVVPTDGTWSDRDTFNPPGNCNKVQRSWLFTVGRDIIKNPVTRADPELMAGFLQQFGITATACLLRNIIRAESKSHRRAYKILSKRTNRAQVLRAVEQSHKRTVAQIAQMRNEPLAVAVASSTQNAVIRANMIMQQAAKDQPRHVRALIKASHPVRIRLFPYLREQAEKTRELVFSSWFAVVFSCSLLWCSCLLLVAVAHCCFLLGADAPLGTQSCVDSKGGHLINTLESVVEYLLLTMGLDVETMSEVRERDFITAFFRVSILFLPTCPHLSVHISL